MFRLADPNETYPTPVAVDVPAPGGGTAPQTFVCRFRLLEDAEIDRLAAESDAALLRRAIAGWSDIADHDGAPLACTEENVDRLARIAYFRRAAVDAYVRFVAGLPEKNSAAPPAAG